MNQAFTVKHFMSAAPVTFAPEENVLDAITKLVRNRISGAPVMDAQGSLIGILSERDCLRVTVTAAYHGDWGRPVREYMSTEVQTVEADMGVVELAERFLSEPFRRYPVVENNRLIGLISRRDILRALLQLRSSTSQ
ncbi:MAG: CBS domain-containing protein [Gammaproteobacteria bacterium]|nr:CBS domain-containing protein [Gammaproteobacteria bacterium]MDH3767482.1 CBS domain-containing protein [Gammaproteobacteria bacterium]